jgi:hypothetical protein
MSRKWLVAGFVLAVVLVACGASSKYMTELKVPQAIQVVPDQATVVFIRPSSYAKPKKHLIVDHTGRFLGEGWGSTYFAVTMPPGEYTFISHSEGTPALKATVEAGKIYYVEVGMVIGAWSPRARLFAIGPQREQWAELPQWLAESDMLAPSPTGAQLFMQKEGEDIGEVIQKGLANYAEYDPEDRQKRTLLPTDGVPTPVPVPGAVAGGAPAPPPAAATTAPPAASPAAPPAPPPAAPASTSAGGCAKDDDCKGNRVCRGGECYDPSAAPGCAKDVDCKGDRVCRNGECVDASAAGGCSKDADCKGGRTCVKGQCVEAVKCAGNDADCPGDLVCVKGTCRSAK